MKDSTKYLANIISNTSANQLYIQKMTTSENLEYRDLLHGQVEELVACRNPGITNNKDKFARAVSNYYSKYIGKDNFVHYPWRKLMLRILGKEEYAELRTNRNRVKITKEEQGILAKKRVGIIGLSVGRSVATVLARERICGSLRLADFDSLELSNLNRIGTGLPDLGLNKSISACREIQELDPYLEVEAFEKGVSEQNLRDFMLNPYKLDILIDECDSLEIKIEARKVARDLGIPVLMDTSDRGMLDVERFDLEQDRPLFHGRLDESVAIGELTNPELRQGVFASILDLENVSERGMQSLGLIGKDLLTWPQLASSVALGGALAAHTTRRIFLGEFNKSGRWYVDLNQLIV